MKVIFSKPESYSETNRPTLKLTTLLLILLLTLGALVSCGPVNQNDSATDGETATVDGDVEEGASGEPVLEANDSDNDSMMRDATQNENRGTSADSDIASGANAADVNVSMTADGNEAWIVTNVEGTVGLENPQEGIDDDADTDTPNPTMTLTVGQRYRFNNPLFDVHVLQFRSGSGDVLLGQGDEGGSFAGNEEVDAVISDNAVTFTVTEALAQAIADYHCAAHQGMTGEIQIQ